MTRTPIRVRDGLSVIEAALRSTFPDMKVEAHKTWKGDSRVWYGQVFNPVTDFVDASISILPDSYGPHASFPTAQFEGDVYTKARAARSAYDVVSAR